MKRDRHQEKRDKQLTPVAHDAIKASPVSPLDAIVEFPIREREKREWQAHQQRLDEVKRLIRKLGRCCREPNFNWPNPEDLKRLDELVLKLARKVRKRTAVPMWKNYKAVDDHWHLKLLRAIEDLVERAAENAPARPLEKYDWLLSRSSLTEMTKQFLGAYREVRHGRDPSSIAWEEFDELFRRVRPARISRSLPRTSRLGDLGGKPKLIAYTVFLEFYFDESCWIKNHGTGASNLSNWVRGLQHEGMLRKLSRFLIPSYVGETLIEDTAQFPFLLAEAKKDIHRARERARKARKK